MSKLTVLGGGGFRAPILAKSLAVGATRYGIDDLVLMDTHAGRLRTYGKLAEAVALRVNPALRVTLTCDAQEALRDADYVITTIRPGAEEGRAFDERTCIGHGVFGQETTGAGGYAMALRSIPAIAAYCALAKRVAKPGAVILNFTNPSGLVTQAMRDLGYGNVYGICDAPSTAFHQWADLLGAPRENIFARSYGLNHLSWFDQITLDGRDITQTILEHPALYQQTDAKLFGPELLALFGSVLPNEYLYFWYFQRKALEAVKAAEHTRGEEIAAINAHLYEALRQMDVEADCEAAFCCYSAHLQQRENSYFSIETGETQRHMEDLSLESFLAQADSGGYAATALDYIRAKHTGEPVSMVLNLPNEGAVPGLADTDVAELSCVLEGDKITRVPAPDISADKIALLRTVKEYENLVVASILEQKPELAIKALTIHPLVADYDIAKKLVRIFQTRYGRNTDL